MAFTETFKNIYAAEKHISVATAIKYIQENDFIDPMLKKCSDNTSTAITFAIISETYKLL